MLGEEWGTGVVISSKGLRENGLPENGLPVGVRCREA